MDIELDALAVTSIGPEHAGYRDANLNVYAAQYTWKRNS